MLLLFSTIVLLFLVITVAYKVVTSHPKFGQLPTGERLQMVQKSPNYKNGAFQNINHTPPLAEGENFFTVGKSFLFGKKVPNIQPKAIPTANKTNLQSLEPNLNGMVWFGHSSYFIQLGGKKFLIDPIFSGAASPFSFSVKAFSGSDVYQVADMPEIDCLLITHDHWDHLDYQTVTALLPKVKKVICGLGVGEHLQLWGYRPDQIIEKDWYETISIAPNFNIHVLPARHFSGRTFKRNPTLWASYALVTSELKIFLGGDSGFDTHFEKIGNEYGPFDFAILENGQYDKRWRYIHTMPEELMNVAKGLQVKHVLPVHSAKFALANHSWDEPLQLAKSNAQAAGQSLLTPKIGEWVNFAQSQFQFSAWWEG